MTNREAARTARLSKRTIDALPSGDARVIVWDTDLAGFGLRIEPSGLKTFVVRYRVGGGRRGTLRQFKIGRYGKLTPEEARAEARDVLAQAELGKDPQAVKRAERAVLTVSELCDLYLEEGVGTKKESTLALDRIRIKRHIKPLIGGKRITEVAHEDITRLMHDIASGRVRDEASPHTRGGQGAASRTVGLLSGIFKFAINRRLCADNPAKGVQRFKDKHRDRLLSPRELATLGDALTAALVQGANASHVAIVRLLALTGARKNEIARLRWSEVDLEGSRLQLADSKTGQKVVRLGAPALEILAALESPRSGWVFPDPRAPELPIRNLDWAWVGFRKRAGLEDVRIHDLRHNYASVGVAGGSSLLLMGKLLGHAHIATTQRYAHLADDPVKAAAERISQSISAAMLGGEGELRRLRGDRR